MSILVGRVILYHSGCHGDHMICTIILGLPVICNPMNVLPLDVHCCLHNSILIYFINTSHRGFLDCARWIWTWFSGYICFGVSVFIVQLYMIHVYFNIKLNLYWIEEISVNISLSQVIRKTMLVTIRARYGLTRLGPIFWKNRGFLTTQIPKIKQQNGPNIVIEAINIEVHATIDNPGWL